MTITEICLAIEKELNYVDNEKISEIAGEIVPEESIGKIDNDDMKDEVIQIIVEKAELDEESAELTYFYLFDEKISIEKENESFYNEETEEFE